MSFQGLPIMPRRMPGHALDLKVPPVAVGILTGALMGAAAWAVPRLGFTFPGRFVAAGGLGVLGAIVAILGVAAFKRAKTTVNPMKPESSSSLVISGVYRMTRNPMYLGSCHGENSSANSVYCAAERPFEICFRTN
jgi:protein-S-isoprenylcysteine O-methyltransferase Ste14